MDIVVKQQSFHESLFKPVGAVTHVEVRAIGQVIIGTSTAGSGYNLDLRGAQERAALFISNADLGLTGAGDVALIYANENYFLEITSYIPDSEDEATPAPVTYDDTTTFPVYPIWPTGESPSPLMITESHPENQVELTYPLKARLAVAQIKAFNAQVDAWMFEAAKHLDEKQKTFNAIGYTISELVGAWMRAAMYSLQLDFQNPSIDQLIVAKKAELARQGATDVESVADFLNSVYASEQPPTTHPTLWVSESGGVVSRTSLKNVVQNTTVTLPADYSRLDLSWLTENQSGTVTLSDTSPESTKAVTATLLDPDGGTNSLTYQWQKKVGTGEWTDITSANTSSYTPVSGDVGAFLRCVVQYNDNYQDNNTATSAATSAVV